MRRTHLLLHFILTVLILTRYYGISNCPAGFEDMGDDLCFLNVNIVTTYCNAQEECANQGAARGLRLFIPGRHAAKIAEHFSYRLTIFTSWNAHLNRPSDLRSGWRVGDPGSAAFATKKSDTSVPWGPRQPDCRYQAVAMYHEGLLQDEEQDTRLATSVVCELSRRPLAGSPELFRSKWPRTLKSLFMSASKSTGCFHSILVSSLVSCGMK